MTDVITNSTCSSYTKEDLHKNLSKEERETFLDYLFSIQFLQNMTNPDRPYARHLKRWDDPYMDQPKEDPKGRIKPNLTNPHILEDTDYFRPAALKYEKDGVYTHLMPSRNPYSAYVKHWNEEIRRCWYGYTRESDGEWITGYHYFYLNYCQIRSNRIIPGKKRVDRSMRFPDFYDGDYLFFHYMEYAREMGKHTCTLKKRGAGYSFKAGAKLARNFILGENEHVSKEAVSLAVANEKEYLTKDGVLNKFVSIIDFCGDNTPFPRRRELKDSWNLMHWVMGYKDSETGLEKGTKNEVMGVTLKNDPEKARGKRAVLIEWEEFGKFNNALKAWVIGLPSVQEDGFTFGIMNAYGTGGTEGAAFEGLRELFYSPDGYNVQAMPNVFDKNAKPGTQCAFFHGSYLNAKGYYDKDGNSDVTAALLEIIKERIKVKYNSKDPATIVQITAEKPVTPQEAIMRVGGNIFPVTDIRDHLEEARANYARFTNDNLVGDLVLHDEHTVTFKPNPNKTPIRKYVPDRSNVEGALEIFKLPPENPEAFRFIGGIDPVDNDYVEKGSLASIFIFDLWTDQIVAEYTGRPQLAEDFYEICRRLLIFYNAQANYESNIKGLFGYFNNKNCLYLLSDTPQYLRDIAEVKKVLYGNASKGTRTTQGIADEGKRLQKSWLLSQYHYQEEGKEQSKLMLRTIKSLGYLEELYEWNPEGNFDRVSAMDMVMILRKDRQRVVTSLMQNEETYIEEDEFIKANFDSKFNQEGVDNIFRNKRTRNDKNKLSKAEAQYDPEKEKLEREAFRLGR